VNVVRTARFALETIPLLKATGVLWWSLGAAESHPLGQAIVPLVAVNLLRAAWSAVDIIPLLKAVPDLSSGAVASHPLGQVLMPVGKLIALEPAV
jgi:hypothetical protein